MDLRKLVQNLAAGEIACFVDQTVLQFCEVFLKKNIAGSNEKLEKLAFNTIRKKMYSDKPLRDRLVDVASKQEVGSMLRKASELKEFSEEQKAIFDKSEGYALLKLFLEKYTDNISLVDYLFGISDSYKLQINQSVKHVSRIAPNYELYPYQFDLTNKIKALFFQQKRGLLHLPTGAGKTRTAISYICDFINEDSSRLVIWLADRNELCEQALEEFSIAWKSRGNIAATSYGYFGNSGGLTLGGIDKGFLVCSVQSLWAVRNSDRDILYKMLSENASLVVFDEAHKAAANTYSNMLTYILETSSESLLLGLTATPGRAIVQEGASNEENESLAAMFDNNKITMTMPGYLSPIQYLYDKNYLAKPEFLDLDYSDDTVLTNVVGDFFKSDAIDALSDSELRNRAILQCVIEEVGKGSFIIIFANTVKHARNLEGLFQLFDINAMSVDSSTKERAGIINSYRKKEFQVLINYEVLTAGFDAPHTNVAIIARPTNSLVAYSQMAGRAMRGGKTGNATCKIYTVNDEIPEFRSVARAFIHWDRHWS